MKLTQLIYSPVELLVSILLNYQSRAHEYQADAFAVSLGHAEMLKQALVKMSEKNLANQSPDAWYALVHYSHPSLNERLRAIDLEVERLLKERKVGKESKKVK